MGESNKRNSRRVTEEVIAAFDREREEAHEHVRRHLERLRSSSQNDRQVSSDRQRQK
jgi:hypothetical protein